MGLIDPGIFNQLKKAQGETNERLDQLVTAQNRTNQLLEWLGQLIAAERAERPG
jgi:hypothetical protein